tara:strand:+ start:638 stop:1792 length:1155 start_codon:yes stop_codon:yes gene_type:complete
MKTKNVAVVIASRANYGRCKSLLKAIDRNSKLSLTLIVCGSAILDKFGETSEVIKKDGFKINYECNFLLAGSDLKSQATTTGLAIIQLTELFSSIQPNYVVTIADRYETLATAIAASYQNIPLIHLQGGDISGNIDDKVRHAITRLSDYHFPASEKSYHTLIKMGESKKRIWMYGCPSMDLLKETISFEELKNMVKVLKNFKKKNFFLILLHPVTDKPDESLTILDTLIESLEQFKDKKIVVISPNVDAGSEKIRISHEKLKTIMGKNLVSIENLPPTHFLALIKNSQICLGNSSSFLREAGLCGVPALILGTRQKGREMAQNCIVLESPSKETIVEQIRSLLQIKSYPSDKRFGDGISGEKIAAQICSLPIAYSNKEKLFFSD